MVVLLTVVDVLNFMIILSLFPQIQYMNFTMEKPNERQYEFMTATKRFIGYGGARGGGKSWAVRRKAELLALSYEGIRILIVRRTFPQLRENHINPMRKELHGVAKYKESSRTFTFANGSVIVFGFSCSAK